MGIANGVINRGAIMLSQIDRFRVFAQESFTCQKCGNCCIDSDPIVIYEADIKDLMKFFKLPRTRIIKKYLTPYGEGRDSCVYKLKYAKPCKFMDNVTKQCKIYEARPTACKLYPFLSSEGVANGTCGYTDCPGSVEFINWSNQDHETQVMMKVFELMPIDQQKLADKWLTEKIRSYLKGMI
jgi:Fe-S-cluster containining protein